MKIGILSFAHMHAASYASALGPNLVGISDPDAARGQRMADTFSTRFFESDDALLGENLDGVIVTSENVRHRELTEKAAGTGVKAVLCEKPLATTTDDARAMIDICASKNVKLATAFPCRYAAAFQRVKALVKAGNIGEIRAIRGTNRGRMPGGWFVEREKSGGGAVIDHTVHVADLNRVLLGKEAVEVYAEIGSGFHHKDWDDTGFLTIGYEDGVFATLDTSWSRPNSYPTWGDVTLQIVGTAGVLEMDMFAQNLVHYKDRGSGGSVSWRNWGSGMDDGLVADFLKLCVGETTPDLATGEDGLRALEVALAAYRSAQTGEPITL